MELRDGMLGVVIIAVALSVALFGSYFAGVTSYETEVINYKWLADVSGEFDYDQSPQYIDFDPSSNYTGYFSNDSYSEIMNKYYFAKDEVEFIPNVVNDVPVPNNYKIDFEPEVVSEVTINLSTLDPEEMGIEKTGAMVRYVYAIEGDYVQWFGFKTTDAGAYILKDLLIGMGLTEQCNHVRISLGDSVNWNDTPHHGLFYDTLDLNTVLLIPYDKSKIAYITSPDFDTSKIEGTSVNIMKPYLSIDVDLKTWEVQCYFTSDYSGTAEPKKAESMIICYGDTNDGEGSGYDHLNLSYEMDYVALKFEDPQYLNPMYGVSLKDGE